MATTTAVDLLRAIERRLASIERLLTPRAEAEVADDRDLDSQYGDPVVKFLPRDWHGDNYKGSRFSECPAELLDQLASAFDYFARKAEENGETTNSGKPKAPYNRRDAARARGWAKRIRGGWKPAQMAPASAGPWVDEGTGEIHEPAGDPWATDGAGEFGGAPGDLAPAVTELTADDIPF